MNALILFADSAPDAGGDAILGGFMLFVVFIWLVAIALTIFMVWMLIDALVYEQTTEQKILWFLVIFFLHPIGAFVYLFMRKLGKARSSPGG